MLGRNHVARQHWPRLDIKGIIIIDEDIKTMPTIYDCDSSVLVEKTSEELKKVDEIKAPEWALYAKTGMQKDRPPVKKDWWYARSASVLRQVYRYGPIGVSKLRTRYGGKKNRGMKKSHFYKGSGNILRKILQQLEKAGFVKAETKSVHKGRVLTAEGKKFLNSIVSQIATNPYQKAKKKQKADTKVKTEKKSPESKTAAEKKPESVEKKTKVEIKQKKNPEAKAQVKAD